MTVRALSVRRLEKLLVALEISCVANNYEHLAWIRSPRYHHHILDVRSREGRPVSKAPVLSHAQVGY